jgi:hypothetical protein
MFGAWAAQDMAFALKLDVLSIMRPDTISRKNIGKFV